MIYTKHDVCSFYFKKVTVHIKVSLLCRFLYIKSFTYDHISLCFLCLHEIKQCNYYYLKSFVCLLYEGIDLCEQTFLALKV